MQTFCGLVSIILPEEIVVFNTEIKNSYFKTNCIIILYNFYNTTPLFIRPYENFSSIFIVFFFINFFLENLLFAGLWYSRYKYVKKKKHPRNTDNINS